MDNKIEISYGAISDKLIKQLKNQGLNFPAKDIELLQGDLDAMIRLRIRGYIADSAYDKILKGFHGKFMTQIKKHNKAA